MGWAEIVGNLGGGRYTIKLDYGEATRKAVVETAKQAVETIDQQLRKTDELIEKADALEANAKRSLDEMIQSFIDADNPAAQKGALAIVEIFSKQYYSLVASNLPLRRQRQKLSSSKAEVLRKLSYWSSISYIAHRDVWCATYSINANAGYVATLDMKAEADHMVLAPNLRPPTNSFDGIFTPTTLMSPEQAFLNYAILPGVQKHRPVYRTGTITHLDRENNLADVNLTPAHSVAQGLGVNLVSSFKSIPVVYMGCHHEAFDEGDPVVVEVLDDQWSTANVIGFVTDPRPCPVAPSVTMDLVFNTVGESGGSTTWTTVYTDDLCPALKVRHESNVTGMPEPVQIAPAGSSTIVLGTPIFAESAAGMELIVEGGMFGELWADNCSALGWGTSSTGPGSTLQGSAPGGDVCDSIQSVGSGGNILITRTSRDASLFSTSVNSYREILGSAEDIFCGNPIFPASSGAWIVPGTYLNQGELTTVTEVLLDTTAIDFVTLPTIHVTRAGGTGFKIPYELVSVETISDAATAWRHTVWRFHFERAT